MAQPKLSYLKRDHIGLIERTQPPATPAAGRVRAYNIGGVWYGIDDAGLITRLTGGAIIADDNTTLAGITGLIVPESSLYSPAKISVMPDPGQRRVASLNYGDLSNEINVGMGFVAGFPGGGSGFQITDSGYAKTFINATPVPGFRESGIQANSATDRFQIGYQPHYICRWVQLTKLYEVAGQVPSGWSGMFTAVPATASASLTSSGVAGFGFRTNFGGSDSDIYAVCSNGTNEESVSMGVSLGVITSPPYAPYTFECWTNGTQTYFRVNGGTIQTLSAGYLPAPTTALVWCHFYRRFTSHPGFAAEFGLHRMSIEQN